MKVVWVGQRDPGLARLTDRHSVIHLPTPVVLAISFTVCGRSLARRTLRRADCVVYDLRPGSPAIRRVAARIPGVGIYNGPAASVGLPLLAIVSRSGHRDAAIRTLALDHVDGDDAAAFLEKVVADAPLRQAAARAAAEADVLGLSPPPEISAAVAALSDPSGR